MINNGMPWKTGGLSNSLFWSRYSTWQSSQSRNEHAVNLDSSSNAIMIGWCRQPVVFNVHSTAGTNFLSTPAVFLLWLPLGPPYIHERDGLIISHFSSVAGIVKSKAFASSIVGLACMFAFDRNVKASEISVVPRAPHPHRWSRLSMPMSEFSFHRITLRMLSI